MLYIASRSSGPLGYTPQRSVQLRSRPISLRNNPIDGLPFGSLGHQDASAEDADRRTVLIEAFGLDGHHPSIGFRRGLPLVEDRGPAVDRVARERRRRVPQRFDLEVGDGLAGH